jgi:hypothetical protein
MALGQAMLVASDAALSAPVEAIFSQTTPLAATDETKRPRYVKNKL